ncbi:MAG: M56 family metallopeptidase [Evtepia gabavorous]
MDHLCPVGVVFLRMICPVGLSLPVSLVPQAITSGAYVQHLLPAEPGPAQETVPVQDTPAPAEHTLSAGDGTPPAPAAPADIPRPALLTGVWAAGAAATLLWAAVSYARLRRQVAEAVPVEKGVYESDRVSTPFVCGLLRPRIYLPASSRRKTVTMSCSMSGPICAGGTTGPSPWPIWPLCLHWFNPLLWLAYRLFCRDVEASCDQAVIRPLGREDTARYAATLLHLGCRSGFPATVPLAFGTEDTKGRIRAVLSYRRPALWLILATAAACLAAGLFLLGTPTDDWRAGPLTKGMVFSYGETLPSQSPCWRSCWLSATDMTEIWSPCLPSPLKRTPESFSRARKTTGKFFAGTTLSWYIRLPPAEKTGNPNRTV